jgi:hypothetical protein
VRGCAAQHRPRGLVICCGREDEGMVDECLTGRDRASIGAGWPLLRRRVAVVSETGGRCYEDKRGLYAPREGLAEGQTINASKRVPPAGEDSLRLADRLG